MNAEHKPGYAAVEADLLGHYQLSHDPFLPRTPGFRFFTARRKSVLAELHHLARFAQQMLVVTGPRSSGKTLLRQVLVASTNKDNVQCVVVSGREIASHEALLGFLAQTLDTPARTETGVLEKAADLYQTGLQLYIVVDDAHLLSAQALQSLADMSQINMRGAPRVFLFAEPSIDMTLRAVGMPAERAWLHVIALQPFRPDETRDYLAQRLEAAGQGLELLSEGQLEWIHQQSEGWPGRINLAGRESMLAAIEPAAVPQRRATAFPVRSLIALVLVSIAVAAVWMLGADDEPEPQRTVLELPKPAARVNVENDGVTERQSPSFDVVPPPARAPAPQAIPELAPSEPEPVLEIEPFVDEEAEPTTAESVAPAVVTPPAAEPPRDRPAAVATGEHASWYREQAPGSYALQLLGTRSKQAAEDFVAKHSSVANVHYFETSHEGKPWFVVTQGAYGGRQQAQQSVAGLPESVRKLKPWPRSMGSIQQSLP